MWTAAAVAALALAGAGCGDDAGEQEPDQPNAPVNTDTPNADPENSPPPPTAGEEE